MSDSKGTFTTQYTAASLNDLAAYIEARADEVEAQAVGAKTQKEAARWKAQAYGMWLAARIVRNTTIDTTIAKEAI